MKNLKNWIFSNILTVSTILIIIGGIITYANLPQEVEGIKNKIVTVEGDIVIRMEKIDGRVFQLEKDIQEFRAINAKLDSMDKNLNYLIELHLNNKGQK